MVRNAVTAPKSYSIPPLGATDLGNGITFTVKDGMFTITGKLVADAPTYDKATGVGRKNWSYASSKGNVRAGNGMQIGLNIFGVQPADLGK